MYCIEAYKPPQGSDKYSRIGVQSIKFESGRVYLPSEAPWLGIHSRGSRAFPEANMTIMSRFDQSSSGISVVLVGQHGRPWLVFRTLLWFESC